jgi:hypothetical protein
MLPAGLGTGRLIDINGLGVMLINSLDILPLDVLSLDNITNMLIEMVSMAWNPRRVIPQYPWLANLDRTSDLGVVHARSQCMHMWLPSPGSPPVCIAAIWMPAPLQRSKHLTMYAISFKLSILFSNSIHKSLYFYFFEFYI